MLTEKSPLRYPGGKSRAVKTIINFIPKTIDKLISPFIGGGSIEIALSHLGIKVNGYDTFIPLVYFWQELLEDSNRLADEVYNYFPMSKKTFYELQKLGPFSKLEIAAIFYALNRSSFSGSTFSGGMSPKHPRFTESSIEYLRSFSAPNLSVKCGDFHETISSNTNEFLYCDPPYLIDDALYGNKGDMHRRFDHLGLYELLNQHSRWVLSYNDCVPIRMLYSKFLLFTPQWSYGMSKNKISRELIILSEEVAENFLENFNMKSIDKYN